MYNSSFLKKSFLFSESITPDAVIKEINEASYDSYMAEPEEYPKEYLDIIIYIKEKEEQSVKEKFMSLSEVYVKKEIKTEKKNKKKKKPKIKKKRI